MTYIIKNILLIGLALFLGACGFHLQGEVHLAPPLHQMSLQSQDPYGHLARYLENYLKMSGVQLVNPPNTANTMLSIQNDSTSQSLLSVSATQQTRQYNLAVSVTFEITDKHGKILVPAETLTESRTLTIQSNQVLGSSNEATIIYQQIRRSLANAIITRIASQDVTDMVNHAYPSHIKRKST